MSKRSPFWQPFATHTPLGYAVAGFFYGEPGPNYGALRFTHVDGLLPRAYTSPGIPEPLPAAQLAAALETSQQLGGTDLRAVERPDGTPIAFYPLYNAEGALVEVVPRTRDTAVVVDTPWRPLAALVRAARHAGIEEAVRRQRAVFLFSLEGAENARIVRHDFPLRLTLTGVLRGNSRTLAGYPQVKTWARNYGLDLPITRAEFDHGQSIAEMSAQLRALSGSAGARPEGEPVPGSLSQSGVLLWLSSRGGGELVDLPGGAALAGTGGVSPIMLWDIMARLADRGLAPSWERIGAELVRSLPGYDVRLLKQSFGSAWERWAALYPAAFAGMHDDRVAV